MRERTKRRAFLPITVKANLDWDLVSRIEVNLPDLPGTSIEVDQSRSYPYGGTTSHVLGYVGTPAENEVGDDPLLQLPGIPHRQERAGKGLRHQAARHRRHQRGRGERARPRHPRARPARRPTRRRAGQHARHRAAGIRPAAPGIPAERRLGGDRRLHRRCAGHGLDAQLRSQHLQSGAQRRRLAAPQHRSRPPPHEQDAGRPISARLDLQDHDGAGSAGGRRRSELQRLLSGIAGRGQYHLPLLVEGRPWHPRHAGRDQAFLRRLLL